MLYIFTLKFVWAVIKLNLKNKKMLTSLISPTSKCLSLPFVSAGPNWPVGPALTGVHGDVMVPAPTTLSVTK